MVKNRNKNSSGRIIRDIFIISMLSAFSGFILGLIFAPESGKKFRRRILSQLKEAVDRSKFAVVEARVKAEEIIDKSKSKSEDISSKKSIE